MTADQFINILTEAQIIKEKPDEDEEPPVEAEGEEGPVLIKFYDEHVLAILKQLDLLHTGDDDTECMTYIDFLDALVRVSIAYPWESEDSMEFTSKESKLEEIVDRIRSHNEDIGRQFMDHLDKADNQVNFKCSAVVL